MKIITLWQPWATLIALDLKRYETRHWKTNYRGKIAIHAAKRKVSKDELATISCNSVGHLTWEQINQIDYPLGVIVAIADLVDCLKMNPDYEFRQIPGFISLDTPSVLEKAVGDWKSGRYAWVLKDVIALSDPIPYKGMQGIGNVSEDVRSRLLEVAS